MKSLQPTEHEIQSSIIEYLQLKGYYVMRLNSGLLNTGKSFVKMGEAGTPDLMAFKNLIPNRIGYDIRLFFIEVKRPGKKPTDLQKQKMKELTEYGARCIVATSIDDVEKGL